MDNVTHSLFALTIARTPLGRVRGSTVALLLASNAPDVDVVTAAAGTANYLQWHRGPTHGLLGIASLGLLTAAVVWGALRFLGSRETGGGRAFGILAAVSTIGVALHIAMDLPTSYGTRILSPFDWHWYSTDWIPIIDVYLIVALGAGLYFGRSSAAARRWNVAIVLVLMIANYGVRGIAHHRALTLAPRLFGPTLPAPCEGTSAGPILAYWPRATPTLPPPGSVRCLIEIAAIPTFTSPFEWRVIAKMSNAYELHNIDVLHPRFRTPAPESEVLWRLVSRYPNQWSAAAGTAASTPMGQVFLGFSRFPAVRTFRDQGGSQTVQFTDMRFLTPFTGMRFGANQTARSGGPGGRGRGFGPDSRSIFTATIRLDRQGGVVEERLGP